MKKITFLLFFLSSISFATMYDIIGYMDFKTKSLRDTTYNSINSNKGSLYIDYIGIISKTDFATQTGTTTANAFYRVWINYNFKVNSKLTPIKDIFINIFSNTNTIGYDITIFNSHNDLPGERNIPDDIIGVYKK